VLRTLKKQATPLWSERASNFKKNWGLHGHSRQGSKEYTRRGGVYSRKPSDDMGRSKGKKVQDKGPTKGSAVAARSNESKLIRRSEAKRVTWFGSEQ